MTAAPPAAPAVRDVERLEGLLVDRVVVRVLEAPLVEPVPMSFSQLRTRRTCLVEVWADGCVGVGETWINYPDWAPAERVATLTEGVAPLVLGTDVGRADGLVEGLHAALAGVARQWGAPGPVWQAISGVDLALWDLRGRLLGSSVGRLLGDARESAPVYASGIGPTRVEELCERAGALGVTAVKAKVGFGDDVDGATIAAIRRALPRVRIFADANCAWPADTADGPVRALLDAGVEWVEEPLADGPPDALAQLHARTGMPLAAGENVYGPADLLELARTDGVVQVQPDPAKSGGITVAQRVAGGLAGTSCRLSPHWYAGAVGLRASLALVTGCEAAEWIEYDVRDNPLREELLGHPFALDAAGRMPASDVDGLCADLDDEAVARFTTRVAERTSR